MDKFWLFTPEQLQQVHNIRSKAYQPLLLQDPGFDDRILQNFNLRNLIKINRKYKSSDHPFLREKVLETAVNLYKRYYLVKSFMHSDPQQIIMCASYLAVKIQQLDDKGIQKHADRLSTKAYQGEKTSHYGQVGYTECEMSFLSAINFEIKTLSSIRPFESMMLRIRESCSDDSTKLLSIEKEFFKMIEKTYYDDIFWLVHPAKTAVAIILILLKKYDLPIECIDKGDLKDIVEKNNKEIGDLMKWVSELPEYNQAETSQISSRYNDMMKDTEFRKPPTLKRNSVSSIGHLPP